MTAEELDRLSEFEAAATKEWVVADGYVGAARHPFFVRGDEDGIRIWDDQMKHDIELAAALRNAAPRLLALANNRQAVQRAGSAGAIEILNRGKQWKQRKKAMKAGRSSNSWGIGALRGA